MGGGGAPKPLQLKAGRITRREAPTTITGGGDSPIPVSYNQNEWMGSFCPETHLQSAVISEVPTTLKAAGVGREGMERQCWWFVV